MKKAPTAVSEWIKDQNRVLLTDTTFRDAHQSLLATRIRTNEMQAIAAETQAAIPRIVLFEMWEELPSMLPTAS